MDWERTKTIFILAFLLLNVVFAFQLWIRPAYFDSSMYVDQQQIDSKLAELSHRNISVNVAVPRQLKRLKMVTVHLPHKNNYSQASLILGAGAVHIGSSTSPAPGYEVFMSSRGEVTVYNNGAIFYKSASTDATRITSEQARSKAKDFLENTFGLPKDAILARIEETGDGAWVIEFLQRWQRQEFEISRILLHVDGAGVQRMEYYWADILGFTGESIVTIPASGALVVAADNMAAGTVIENIYQTWYSTPMQGGQWRAYPVWVFETDRGMRYYINAFTGEMEGKVEFTAGKPVPTLN